MEDGEGHRGARFARRQGCSCQTSDVKPGIGLCGLAWIGEGRLGNTRCKIGRTGENWLGAGYGEFKDFRADGGKNRIDHVFGLSLCLVPDAKDFLLRLFLP